MGFLPSKRLGTQREEGLQWLVEMFCRGMLGCLQARTGKLGKNGTQLHTEIYRCLDGSEVAKAMCHVKRRVVL
jgi:hypothetical protein